MTIDQMAGRGVGDQADCFLATLDPLAPDDRPGVVRPFERTVGDQVQALFDDAALTIGVALHVIRLGGWSVGIGAGAVAEPLPPTARTGSGQAFHLARDAVEAAMSRARSVPVAVRAANATAGKDCEAVLTLLGALGSRRSAAGWDVIDALTELGPGGRQEAVATRLGISQQAVSQRLRTALWHEEQAARPAAARLLAVAERGVAENQAS